MCVTGLLSGCAEQEYLSDTAQSFLGFIDDWGAEEMEVQLETGQLQVNQTGALASNYDVKKVDAPNKQSLNQYDFSGPENSGLVNEEQVVGLDDSTSGAKGTIYLIPLGIKGGNNGNGILEYTSEVINLYYGAYGDARNNKRCSTHSSMTATEMKNHIKELYGKVTVKKYRTASDVDSSLEEWCDLAYTGTTYKEIFQSTEKNKYVVETSFAEQALAKDGFGIVKGGIQVAGKYQYQVNFEIALATKKLLESDGYVVMMSRVVEDRGNIADYATYLKDAEKNNADAVIFIGTNCADENARFSVQIPDSIAKCDSAGCLKLETAITGARLIEAANQNKAAALGGVDDAGSVSPINCFVNSARKGQTVVYCQCGAFSENTFGKEEATLNEYVQGYAKIISRGVSTAYGGIK